jgi:isopenicillin N synthase-like dioxygenase
MPIPTTPEIRSYEYTKETSVSNNPPPSRRCALTSRLQANLDWADFITIDLSLYSTPEGRKVLARALITAVHEKGFFYLKNFNVPQESIDRQFAISRDFFDLPPEEKQKYAAMGLDQGNPNGYIPAGRRMYACSLSHSPTQIDSTNDAQVSTKSLD